MNISETTPASNRDAEFAVAFGGIISEYCTNDDEVDIIEEALKTALIDNDVSMCLKTKQCVMKFFTCKNEGQELKLTFTLRQTFNLADAIIMSNEIKSFNSEEFLIQYDDGKKRAIVTTDTASDKEEAVITTCGSDTLPNPSGYCVKCELGYGNSNGVCQICDIGYYSDARNISPCTKCQDSTTLAKQSENIQDCVALSTICTVPEEPAHGAFTPTSKTQVASGSPVTVTCKNGYKLSFPGRETFSCVAGVTSPSCNGKM